MNRFRHPAKSLQVFTVIAIASLVSACNHGTATKSAPAPSQSTYAQTPSVATLSMSAATYSVSQSAGAATVTVTRSGATGSAASVNYSTSDGSAAAGGNYTAESGTLSWSAGDAAPKTVSIPISNAAPFSGTKSFEFTLTNPSSGSVIASPGGAAVTITGSSSAASPGSLELSDAARTVAQAQEASVTVTVDRVGGSAGATSVQYATADGTATAGTDYSATTGTLQWTSGDDSPKTFEIPLHQEAAFSGSRTFSVAISSPTNGATIGSPYSETVSIRGSKTPAAGTVDLSAGAYTVDQTAGSLTITADRVGGSSGAISVSYATADGTAVAGTDYTATSGTLKWADGDTSPKMFTVPITNLAAFSGTKTFTVALSSPSAGSGISSPGAATVTIKGAAGGAPGSVDLSSSNYSVSQSAGSVTISVDRTGGSSGAVSVSYATADGTAVAGTDYTSTSGTLQWPDGDSSPKSFSIPISNATALSQTKTFTVALSGATGGATLTGPSSATVSITGGSTSWVYYNGVFKWPGDWSFAATANYQDTKGVPIEGPYDIAITVTSQWGGWQPYAPGQVFDTTPYKYLILSLKPTVANQTWGVDFMSAGDTPDGPQLQDISPYGPPGGAVVGQWGTYKIPLSAFQLTDTSVLKFAIQDKTGLSSNVFYVDNVGFSTN